MSWFRAAKLAREYAEIARKDEGATTKILKLIAEIRADVLEDFACVCEANGRDDKTDPKIMLMPSEAKP